MYWGREYELWEGIWTEGGNMDWGREYVLGEEICDDWNF
jgi:hypothetical protein